MNCLRVDSFNPKWKAMPRIQDLASSPESTLKHCVCNLITRQHGDERIPRGWLKHTAGQPERRGGGILKGCEIKLLLLHAEGCDSGRSTQRRQGTRSSGIRDQLGARHNTSRPHPRSLSSALSPALPFLLHLLDVCKPKPCTHTAFDHLRQPPNTNMTQGN